MEQFSAHEFFNIAQLLSGFNEAFSRKKADEEVPPSVYEYLTETLFPNMESSCRKVGLRVSAALINGLNEGVRVGAIKMGPSFATDAANISNTIRIEMSQSVFMYVPPERASRFNQHDPFGDDVNKSFPSTSFDLRESGNCFAAARYTACVFHLMRALEIGLVTFAKLFPAVPTDKENWQQIIEKIESEIRAIPQAQPKPQGWKEKLEQYSQVANSFMFFKDAWRNYTAHARGKYTEDEADAIYRNVRSFMQGLAKMDLHE